MKRRVTVQPPLLPGLEAGTAAAPLSESVQKRRKSRRYGIPYMGSKNRLARQIVEALPPARHFYDLFSGGCAVVHAALESGKWQTVHANDIDPMGISLFVNALKGKYRDERRCLDRAEFERLRSTSPYARFCWSFGGNGTHYLWNDVTAGAKLLVARMVMADDWHERLSLWRQLVFYLRERRAELKERRAKKAAREAEVGNIAEHVRLELRHHLEESGKRLVDVDRYLGTNGMAGHYFGAVQWEFPVREKFERMREILPSLPDYEHFRPDLEALSLLQDLTDLDALETLEEFQSLESIDSLQRLEGLQMLEGKGPKRKAEAKAMLDRLECTALDYRQVEILPDSVIYCDIPYIGTEALYCEGFSHADFYEWAEKMSNIYVSEYQMPEDRFDCIWQIHKTCMYAATSNNTPTIEKVFVPKGNRRVDAFAPSKDVAGPKGPGAVQNGASPLATPTLPLSPFAAADPLEVTGPPEAEEAQEEAAEIAERVEETGRCE